jgi:hypothetical protein
MWATVQVRLSSFKKGVGLEGREARFDVVAMTNTSVILFA